MTLFYWRSVRSCSARRSGTSRGYHDVERLEPRRLFNTVQVVITPQLASVNARDVQNLPINFRFNDLAGMITFSGNNLSVPTAGRAQTISGNVTSIDGISLTSSTSRSSFSLAKPGSLIPLGGFDSSGQLNSINLLGTDLTGTAQLVAPPVLTLGNVDSATVDITQNLPSFNFTAWNVNGSTFNITGPGLSSPAVNLRLRSVSDTQIATSDVINSLRAKSFTESASGLGGISAGGAGSFNIAGDFKSDFRLTPSLSLKYTLNDLTIGQTASGSWNIPGTTRSLSARAFDTGFGGTFGTLSGLRVGTDFSGALSAGSIGAATVGRNLSGATVDLTNPFAANSWNLSSLHVGNAIENSTIRSDGNLGAISTMFTDFSQVLAGISPTYVPGQKPVASDYTSYSTIKSFVSDCPSHHNLHFAGSYVGAAYLWDVHIGNVQTDNFGQFFGLAGVQMERVSVLVNGKTLYFPSLDSTAAFDAGLQKYGLTEPSLGNFTFEFVM